jgi:cholestenol delta-isomerase
MGSLPAFLSAAEPVISRVSLYEFSLALATLFIPIFFFLFFFRSIAISREKSGGWVNWFVVSAIIHSSYEMQFVYFRDGIIANAMDLYGAADFRYGRPLEAGTASMEMITALLVGPLCLMTAYGIVRDRPWRHIVQIVTCTCQMYGLTWFIFQPAFGSGLHSVASDDPFLFWVVFVGLNAPWGIIPPILFIQSFAALNRAVSKSRGIDSGVKVLPTSPQAKKRN